MTIKSVAFTKFRPDLTLDEGRRYWIEEHAKFAMQVDGVQHYLQDHWYSLLDGGEMPFHANSEIWFADTASYAESLASPEWALLAADGPNVFDRPSIVAGLAQEYVLRDAPRAPDLIKVMWIIAFRDDLPLDEARSKWLKEQGPRVLNVPGVVRYEQNHAVKSADPKLVAEETRGFNGLIDGFFSLWFASESDLDTALTSAEWKGAEAALADFTVPGSTYGVRVREHVKR